MKLIRSIIHNIRSIQEADIHLSDYSVIVGANNAGKTNLITALRLFHENEKLSFSKDRDFPKFETDPESWIELTFGNHGRRAGATQRKVQGRQSSTMRTSLLRI